MNLRAADDTDWIACHAVFVASVVGIGEAYTEEEKRAWVDRYPAETARERMEAFLHWVVEKDGVVIGFAGFDPSRNYLEAMFVHPEYQGLGAGKLLMERVVEEARSLGLPEIRLRASKVSERFYGKFGFEDTGEPISEEGGRWMSRAIR